MARPGRVHLRHRDPLRVDVDLLQRPGQGLAVAQHAGATGVGRPLNERDLFLTGQIGPKLAEQGMLFVGLDVIGGYVTEINVTSPTGIRELDKQFGIDIAALLIAAIRRRLESR